MIDEDDIDSIAGEYVLGTLDADGRASVTARRVHDKALDAAIREWESRLSPLMELVPDANPPANLFSKITARIDGYAETVSALRRRVTIWRTSAFAASAIAASLLAVIAAHEFLPKEKPHNLVAVLQKDASSPAFLVTVNIDDRVMTIQPVAAKPEPGKSYELWLVQQSLGAPKSLGIVDSSHKLTRPTLAAYQPNVIKSATFAVSLEPLGGSPTGAPTGPVLFSGKLIPSGSP